MVSITSGVESWAQDVQSENARSSRVSKVELGYDPFPKQQEFHDSPAKYRLFGGAAGPGKTKALLLEAILQAHQHPGRGHAAAAAHVSGARGFAAHYFRRDVPRELYENYNEAKHIVTWLNGSTTRFGYCQRENDVYHYQGAEYLFIGIDELTHFTLKQWQFLTSRNRCRVPGAKPCMAGATNPGNIGHAWVKALWVDQAARARDGPARRVRSRRLRIHSRARRRQSDLRRRRAYQKTLRALPTHLRRAFLDGEWDVFAGQYFDIFDCTRHTVRAEQIATASRGGRAGFRLTGDSSIPARSTGTRQFRAVRP